MLGNDLSFQFGVNIVDKNINTEGAYMQFHFNGTVTTVAEFKTSGEYIYFIFDGISPDQMTASITAILFIDGSEAAKLENYSVEKNLRGILATTTDATLIELIHKTLLYGQAAQNYHENENPAIDDTGLNTDGVTANQSDAMTLQGNSSANPIRITAVGVHFDRYNSYYVKIYVADVAEFDSLTVDGAEYGLSDMYNLGDGYYQFYFGAVDATNFDTRVTVELNSTSQGTVTRLTYSINAYAYAVAGDANADADMKALAHALYNYGKAAEAYYNAHKPQA